jgi:hypothetical protein
VKIALHDNTLSERGTTRSIINLAKALEQYHSFEPVICYRHIGNSKQDLKLIENIQKEFPTFRYSNLRQFHSYCKRSQIEIFYSQKAGAFDGLFVPDALNYIHAVFQSNDPHGHIYSYISKWLLEKVTSMHQSLDLLFTVRNRFSFQKNFRHWDYLEGFSRREIMNYARIARNLHRDRKLEFLPYIVPRFEKQSGFRSHYKIPSDAIVLGVLAGKTSFDINWVRTWIPDFLDRNPEFFFVAPNIDQWFDHPRALWLATLVTNDEKSSFLSEIDAVIHARHLGESFGLAIAECLAAGKPVFASSLGVDRNHIELLGDLGLIYTSIRDLEVLCLKLKTENTLPDSSQLQRKVIDFQPKIVADLFVKQIEQFT